MMFGKRLFKLLVLIGILVNAVGLFTRIMEPDGALYACLAKEMVLRNDFINLYANGADWLDKPHFPFWTAALSYLIFGINSFAYKLPALLFWIIGLVYTYRYSRLLYSEKVAQLASLIYLSAIHLIISNSDVRAEPYLTGMLIAASYHFMRVYRSGSLWQVVWASLWTAAAVMTKGIFVVLIIGSGFVILWLLKRDFRQFLNYRWWLALLLTLIFSLPEVYSVYVQFDLHPELIVFGEQGVSGVRFFFWDSQFGRFFNSGPIQGKGDPFFFIHTTLWAFLPWSVGLFWAVGYAIFRRKNMPVDAVSWGTALFAFLLFSASRFQLPHYLNIVFPFMAVLTAQFLVTVSESWKKQRPLIRVQSLIGWLLILALAGLVLLFFGQGYWWVSSLILLLGAAFWYSAGKANLNGSILFLYGTGLLIGLVYGAMLYPGLLNYQAGMYAARTLDDQTGVNRGLAMLSDDTRYTFDFYSDKPVDYVNWEEWKKAPATKDGQAVLVDGAQLEELHQLGYRIDELAEFKHYHVTKVKPAFVNKQTREGVLERRYLVRIAGL